MENTNPNITARTKKVTNKMSDIAGLHLCEGCRKVNEERIKTLTNYEEEGLLAAIKQLEEKMANEVRCLTQMMEKVTFREEMLKEEMREQTVASLGGCGGCGPHRVTPSQGVTPKYHCICFYVPP
ncbi:hypothetical protein HELRODRAFT_177382 [Helobdella robusta]|uniref:Uncharacterized protein n=1 Tax=Helobdella robusta TaxID=6412 RepID=T1FBL3_HELRO|nr:hypothetical protein HELRODRAFT_177382 [Helobdella robusta]ESN98139.1 hypothetical protein HELRODRAFT_177382 [Helobdella robusta]